ncbi:MAG: SIMPL domain-containing protein [Caldilineaceae bacterium]|nr:SIMPL domain-containing protein [Caldilineaceae bacterium]MDE0198794.1 SIMPL domain-containing protein [Caldilineaceae bacterium]
MQRRKWTRTAICLAATAATALTLLYFVTAPRLTPAALASETTAASARSVTVVGEGVVNIEPDVATARIGVVVLRTTVREASSEASGIMQAVKAALLAQDIKEKDIQTRHFDISAERYGPEGLLPEDQVQYRVRNTAYVTIHDLDNIGGILDAAIEAGANDIGSVRFSLENPSAVESEARAMAVADARAKAEELAALIGATVDEATEISEIIGHGGGFFNNSFSEMAMADSHGPFSIGELTLAMQLQITYKLR